MRISDRYDRFNDRVGAARTGAAKGPDASGGKAAAVPPAAAASSAVLSVKVSDRAAQLAAGSARLEALKAQIRDGTFEIDSRAIANAIVGEDGSGT